MRCGLSQEGRSITPRNVQDKLSRGKKGGLILKEFPETNLGNFPDEIPRFGQPENSQQSASFPGLHMK